MLGLTCTKKQEPVKRLLFRASQNDYKRQPMVSTRQLQSLLLYKEMMKVAILILIFNTCWHMLFFFFFLIKGYSTISGFNMQHLCFQPKFGKTQQPFKYVITMQNCMTNTNRRKHSHDKH